MLTRICKFGQGRTFPRAFIGGRAFVCPPSVLPCVTATAGHVSTCVSSVTQQLEVSRYPNAPRSAVCIGASDGASLNVAWGFLQRDLGRKRRSSAGSGRGRPGGISLCPTVYQLIREVFRRKCTSFPSFLQPIPPPTPSRCTLVTSSSEIRGHG